MAFKLQVVEYLGRKNNGYPIYSHLKKHKNWKINWLNVVGLYSPTPKSTSMNPPIKGRKSENNIPSNAVFYFHTAEKTAIDSARIVTTYN